MKKNGSKKQNGFSLIESLIAIAILMIVVTAMYTVLSGYIKNSFFVSRNITATFLARDGLEYVKHAANSNRANEDTEWLDGLEGCTINTTFSPIDTGNERCVVDSGIPNFHTPDALSRCMTGSCPKFSYSESLNQYGYGVGGDWKETRFTREVSMLEIFSIDPESAIAWSEEPPVGVPKRPDIIKITSTVTWEEDGNIKKVELVDYMFDW